MKNIWWIICLIIVGAGAWYFNQNYLSKVPGTTLKDINLAENQKATSEDKEVLVFIAPDGKTKSVNLEGNIGVLTNPSVDWPNPVFSSDGQNQVQIDFSNAERDFGYSLYVADKNGANRKRIVKNHEAITSPCWSADNKSIYYIQAKSGQTAIMQIALESSEPKEVLSESGIIIDFVLIKDGKIAYLLHSDTRNDKIGDIIVADITDTKTKRILTKATKILGWLP